jgi:dienelactone hydrolase
METEALIRQAVHMNLQEVHIADGRLRLAGTLGVPHLPQGVVLFAHGSGSSRFSPRNRRVAGALGEAGFATLLFDLLTAEEERIDERTRELRFDVRLLAARLMVATAWVEAQPTLAGLDIGYFGASTGAAAALLAASAMPSVRAVVSRGGRPDLAGAGLHAVHAPTLLIVGGADPQVLELNRRALAELQTQKRLEIVPGATHLFEEPGALDAVIALATGWFAQHLGVRAVRGTQAM